MWRAGQPIGARCDTWEPMQLPRRTDSLESVVNALRRITQAIRLSSSVVQDRLGITGAQLFVLQQLAEVPGASLRELAERTLTDQSSVSVVVSRVVAGGYVARRTSAEDARRTELTLTERGRALLRRAPELAQTRLMTALRALSASQLRVAADVLDRAARAMDPTSGPAAMFFEPAVVQNKIAAATARRKPTRRPRQTKRVRTRSVKRTRGSR